MTEHDLDLEVCREEDKIVFKFASSEQNVKFVVPINEAIKICTQALQIALAIDVDISYAADKAAMLELRRNVVG